jgi:hypothetical protein
MDNTGNEIQNYYTMEEPPSGRDKSVPGAAHSTRYNYNDLRSTETPFNDISL